LEETVLEEVSYEIKHVSFDNDFFLSLSIILGLHAVSYALAISKIIIPRLCLLRKEVCTSFLWSEGY